MRHSFPGDAIRGHDLFPRRHQGTTVRKRPAVVLRVGQFEAVGAERGGQLDDLTDPIEVRPVEDDVDREGKSQLANAGARGLLLPDRGHARDPFRGFDVGVLE